MVKKVAIDILVAEQHEAEWPYCALLDAEGMHDDTSQRIYNFLFFHAIIYSVLDV